MAIPIYDEVQEDEEPVGASSPSPTQSVEVHEEESVEEERVSFLCQLVRELVSVYSGISNSGRGQSESGRTRSRSNNEPGTQPQGPVALPDIVCCHLAASMSFSHPQHDDVRVQPLAPQPPTTERQEDFGLGLDIKMQIDYSYGRIGRDLRLIADSYDRRASRRRRHPAGNNSPEMSLKFEFALKVVIPVTFLSLSLAFLRRK